jgi:hypothetical protein
MRLPYSHSQANEKSPMYDGHKATNVESLLRGGNDSPFLSIHIAFVAALSLLLSGWTCSAFFVSCQGVVTQPQIVSLSPGSIARNVESALLTVNGSGFTSQSQIMWDGNVLQTMFVDSHQLQATITQQTFDSFGGSAGSGVQISVSSQGGVDNFGCPIGGNSAALVLAIT